MKRFILAIGSNYKQSENIENAKNYLHGIIDGICFTKFEYTAPIGIDGDWFLNGLAYGETDLSYDNLLYHTKETEKYCGNSRDLREKNIIMMDIDILLYDTKKYHEDDWNREYIKNEIKRLNTLLKY